MPCGQVNHVTSTPRLCRARSNNPAIAARCGAHNIRVVRIGPKEIMPAIVLEWTRFGNGE